MDEEGAVSESKAGQTASLRVRSRIRNAAHFARTSALLPGYHVDVSVVGCWLRGLLFLLTVLSACRPGESDTSTSGNDSDTDTSTEPDFREVIGCNPELYVFFDTQIERTLVGTVPKLTWASSEPVRTRVFTDVGRDVYLESPLATTPATEGELFVLGIPYQRKSSSIVVADTEQGRACSQTLHREPAVLPLEVPELSLTVRDPDRAQGGYMAAGMLTESAALLVVIDEYGEYVWVHPAGPGFISRVYFEQEKSGLEHLSWAPNWDEAGYIQQIDMSGSLRGSIEITGAHTDYVPLPDSAYAAISYDLRLVTDEDGVAHSILGDRIIEVDENGQERVVWSTFDFFSPDTEESYWIVEVGDDDNLRDWTHGNGLTYDAASDDYIISLYGLGSLVRIDRETGDVVWHLSDWDGSFVSTTGELLVQAPHSVELLDDNHLLVFNRNNSNPLDESDIDLDTVCSEAIEIDLSPESGTATKTWSYGSDECIFVVFYGEAQRLENGNTLVIFSSSGQISEGTPEGETVWQVNTDVGGVFTFGERVDSLY